MAERISTAEAADLSAVSAPLTVRLLAADLLDARKELAALRAILDGRTTPPTEAEIVTHHAAGGFWLVRARLGVPNVAVTLASARMAARNNLFALWIPLDAAGHPCAWPTVTP